VTLTLHAFDGREIQVKASHVDTVDKIKVGNKDVTRIKLRTGTDVVVTEGAATVREGFSRLALVG
jgi:hypothetical protein